MKENIQIKYYDCATKLSAELTKKCRDASYRDLGELSWTLTRCRSKKFESVSGKVVVALDPKTKYVYGWALLVTNKHFSDKSQLQLYVKVAYRKQGIGSQLSKTLLGLEENKKEISVFPSSEHTTDKFFEKVGKGKFKICYV